MQSVLQLLHTKSKKTPQDVSCTVFTCHQRNQAIHRACISSHPDLKTFLQICDEQEMQVNLTTNGTLLNACRDVLMNSRLRQVNVSLHSFPEHEQPQYLECLLRV